MELKKKSSTHKYGCIICLNTWDNIVHQPLIIIMQICPADDIFFGSIDIEDIDYVAIMNKSYITGMDPKNVVQVCFNYAVTMHNAISNINHE